MISFRYHIVTIVAVFLALAIGLLGGAAFVQPLLQRELESQTQALQRTNATLREQIDELRQRTTAMDGFSQAALPYLTRDRLIGTDVVVVAHEGIGDAVLAEARTSLEDAGATVVAELTARDTLAAEDPDTRARLAEIVGSSTTADVTAAAATALAGRLATAPASDGADGADPPIEDVLDRLLSDGFLTSTGDSTVVDAIGGRQQVVVVLGDGATETPAPLPEAFGLPLVTRLVALGMRVAVGESTQTVEDASLVTAVRGRVGDAVVTVDDLDLSMGGAALVLGIEDLLVTGSGGSYGFRDGAVPLPPRP